jgi:hypothetical protein
MRRPMGRRRVPPNRIAASSADGLGRNYTRRRQGPRRLIAFSERLRTGQAAQLSAVARGPGPPSSRPICSAPRAQLPGDDPPAASSTLRTRASSSSPENGLGKNSTPSRSRPWSPSRARCARRAVVARGRGGRLGSVEASVDGRSFTGRSKGPLSFLSPPATTLGVYQVYGERDDYQPDSPRGPNGEETLGHQEDQHSAQSRILGWGFIPFYVGSWLNSLWFGGGDHGPNAPAERCPHTTPASPFCK